MHQSIIVSFTLYELEFWDNKTYVLEFAPSHSLEGRNFYSLADSVSILRPVLHSTLSWRVFPHLSPKCLLGSSSYVFDAYELLLGRTSLQGHEHTVDWLVLEGLNWCCASVLDEYDYKLMIKCSGGSSLDTLN